MNISKPLQIAILSSMIFGVELGGYAQVNLVNLYDFTGATQNASSSNQGISADFDSVLLYSAWGINGTGMLSGGFILPILTGNINTTPGTTYEISYTVSHSQQLWFAGLHPVVVFGSSSVDSSGALADGFNPQAAFASDVSVNVDYTYMATSASTPMTFYGYFGDNADSVKFSDISVTALTQVTPVPEVSTASLLGLGGCVWLLASFGRRLFGKYG